MLVRAFEVEVGRRADLRPALRDAVMRDTRVEPDVHDVGDFFVVCRLGAEQRRGIEIEPCVDAIGTHELRDLLEQFRRAWVQFAGFAMREQRERHAPGALARDAPVGAAGDHAVDALLTPGRRPLDLADLGQRGLAQAGLFHADEPLRRGAKDHRRLVPPAVRIAVADTIRDAAACRARTSTSTMCLFASKTFSPANNGVAGRKRPSPPTGLSTGKPYFLPTMKSSWP